MQIVWLISSKTSWHSIRPILSSLEWLQSELNFTQSYYHYLSSAPVKADGTPDEELEGLSLKNWRKLEEIRKTPGIRRSRNN